MDSPGIALVSRPGVRVSRDFLSQLRAAPSSSDLRSADIALLICGSKWGDTYQLDETDEKPKHHKTYKCFCSDQMRQAKCDVETCRKHCQHWRNKQPDNESQDG